MDANEEMFADTSHPDADTDASCFEYRFWYCWFLCQNYILYIFAH